MKILVFAHRLDLGGSQVNAIELAATLRDRYGHDVVLFATPGPSVKLADEQRLRFLPAPDAHSHPSLPRMRALAAAARRERPDLIHVWDWPQCLDAYYVVHLLQRIPIVVSDMSMCLCRVLPRMLPTTFGIPALVEQARAAGRRRVELVLPPVDVMKNAPGAVDPQPFRAECGIRDGDLTLVTVSRLVESMKAESLRRTLDVVRRLGRKLPLRFIIVGEGPARLRLERLAVQTNAELGRRAVVLAGPMVDPRPAYAAADIVVGMGGSALRGMAFGKPVVIVGEQGFSAPFNADSADSFYHKGLYGLGDGNPANTRLMADIRGLAEQPGQLESLGHFSRQFVHKHFALEVVAARLEAFCRTAVGEGSRFDVAATDGLRTAALLFGRHVVPPSIRQRLITP
jgi:glycosyltransferase involved in cell wall biosynthesis